VVWEDRGGNPTSYPTLRRGATGFELVVRTSGGRVLVWEAAGLVDVAYGPNATGNMETRIHARCLLGVGARSDGVVLRAWAPGVGSRPAEKGAVTCVW
jgi:hypothetical protein